MTLRGRAAEIASNRDAGASELLAQVLPLLREAITSGRETVIAVARVIAAGQPAMAPLWNASAAAAAEFDRAGTFDRLIAELEHGAHRLTRAAVMALNDALQGEARPQFLTLSYSSSVANALCAIASHRPLTVVCGESRPGGEGVRLQQQLAAAGADVQLVADAALTTYLPTATAVVVGADAISADDWTNKCGTFGLSAAAAHTGTPVYVVAARIKAEAAVLRARVRPSRVFERTPVGLATLFLTDVGVIPPANVAALSERYAPELKALLAHL